MVVRKSAAAARRPGGGVRNQHQQADGLQMAREAAAQSGALRGVFGQRRRVRHHRAAVAFGKGDKAQLRRGGGEGILRHFGAGGGDCAQQRGFSAVWRAAQGDLGGQLKLQFKAAGFARLAGGAAARRAIGGGFKPRVAHSAASALRQNGAFAGGV